MDLENEFREVCKPMQKVRNELSLCASHIQKIGWMIEDTKVQAEHETSYISMKFKRNKKDPEDGTAIARTYFGMFMDNVSLTLCLAQNGPVDDYNLDTFRRLIEHPVDGLKKRIQSERMIVAELHNCIMQLRRALYVIAKHFPEMDHTYPIVELILRTSEYLGDFI
jgi:hypothetical protein